MAIVHKHTDSLSREHLVDLLQQDTAPCISIYMPTIRMGAQTAQNGIRLKNLLTEVEDRLRENDLHSDKLREVVEQASLLPKSESWDYLSDGLVIFLAPDHFEYIRLSLDLEERAIIQDRFYIPPLLRVINQQHEFYLLALDQSDTRLLHGTARHIEAVILPDTPRSLDEALRFDENEKSLQFHAVQGPLHTVFHGQGLPDDVETQNIVRFFQMINNGVYNELGSAGHAPLILAGIERLRGLYRKVNSYEWLLDEDIDTHPSKLREEELHQMAWDRVEPMLQHDYQAATDAYFSLAGNDDQRALNDFQHVVLMAFQTRVDTLFVAEDVQRWGVIDIERSIVEVQNMQTLDNTELINFAVEYTLLNGGQVFLTTDQRIVTDRQPLATILRY